MTDTGQRRTQSNGTGTATLTHYPDNSIKGQQLGLPGEISDQIIGRVSGTRVTLTETLRIQVTQSGTSVTCAETIEESLTVSSNRNMRGTFTLRGTCTFNTPVPIAPITVWGQEGAA